MPGRGWALGGSRGRGCAPGGPPGRGADARTARDRFAAAESCFREELRSPAEVSPTGAHDGTGWWRAYTAGNPLEAARDLDDWVLRHGDGDGDGGGDLGPTPVSGGLHALYGAPRPPGPCP